MTSITIFHWKSKLIIPSDYKAAESGIGLSLDPTDILNDRDREGLIRVLSERIQRPDKTIANIDTRKIDNSMPNLVKERSWRSFRRHVSNLFGIWVKENEFVITTWVKALDWQGWDADNTKEMVLKTNNAAELADYILDKIQEQTDES